MKRLIKISYLFVSCALLSLSMAKEVIKIDDWNINNMNSVEIYYFLNSTNDNKNTQFYITPMVSIDNGVTWFKPKSIDGNHGLQTATKSKKIIIWDIFSDKNKLKGKLKVKLIAKAKASTLSSLFFNRNKFESVSRISKPINLRKKPAHPPTLYVERIKFYEPSGNEKLDAEEEGYFEVIIQNKGKGRAMDLAVHITQSKGIFGANKLNGLFFPSKKILGDIKPGERRKYRIPITADLGIITKKISLDFRFSEANDFPPKSNSCEFSIKSFSPPQLVLLEESRINDPSGNGMIETGEVVELSRKIQNIGQGIAKNVVIRLTKGAHVFFTETTSNKQVIEFSVGDLLPNESKEFSFHFYANTNATEIPIFATVTESRGKYGVDKTRFDDIELNKRMRKFDFIADDEDDIIIAKESGYGIDVRNVPHTKMKNEDGVAVIIGNRDYENDIPSVDFALRDAEFVKQYLINTMGYDKQNIIHVENATLATMIKVFLKAKNYYKEGKSDIFIYYSGHGAPNFETNQSYFVPIDADPNFIKKTGYALNDLYELLNELDAKSFTVVIDACFSGRTESGDMLLTDSSPLAWEANNSQLIKGNSTVFTSASGKQISSWYREKKHSLFTYFFLKALQGNADENNDKQLTISEIETYINEHVPYQARRIDRQQTPEVTTSNKDRVLVRY